MTFALNLITATLSLAERKTNSTYREFLVGLHEVCFHHNHFYITFEPFISSILTILYFGFSIAINAMSLLLAIRATFVPPNTNIRVMICMRILREDLPISISTTERYLRDRFEPNCV